MVQSYLTECKIRTSAVKTEDDSLQSALCYFGKIPKRAFFFFVLSCTRAWNASQIVLCSDGSSPISPTASYLNAQSLSGPLGWACFLFYSRVSCRTLSQLQIDYEVLSLACWLSLSLSHNHGYIHSYIYKPFLAVTVGIIRKVGLNNGNFARDLFCLRMQYS